MRSMANLFVSFVALSCLLHLSFAIKIIVGPGRTECVSEAIGSEHFDNVLGGARIDGRVIISGYSQYFVPFVTIKVMAPDGEQVWQQQHVYSETHVNVGAKGPGTYSICFHNPWESRTDAVVDLVYFTLAHLRQPSGTGVLIPKGRAEDRSKEVAHGDHMDQMRQSILGLSEFMTVVQGSQRYLQRKLDRHMETVVSNRRRTLIYTLLESGTLIAMMGLQIFMICRLFKGGRGIKLTV